ncbi:MAG: CRTAC1 family protein, partial [Acidobacteria bacterium]
MKLLLGVFTFMLVCYAGVASLRGSSQVLPAVHFVDITDTVEIRFKHTSAPDKKYIVESMSGGVALFDYDKDGCLDIYFTNALTVETASDPK